MPSSWKNRATEVTQAISEIVDGRLRSAATAIDQQGEYPRSILQGLGEAGAFASLADGDEGLVKTIDLHSAITASRKVAAACVSTAFCCWCQGALVWYLRNSTNPALRQRLLARAASGQVLGGTALSNPMKYVTGLENLRLSATGQNDGASLISGTIPWVSNVEENSPFGMIFSQPDKPPAMALADSSMPGLSIKPNDNFETMAGTATVMARFENVPITEKNLLADNAVEFIGTIKAGFILLQAGIGLGIIEEAAAIIEQSRRTQPSGSEHGLLATSAQLQEQLGDLDNQVAQQAARASSGKPIADRELFGLRRELVLKAIRAATAAQLVCGAGGLGRGRRSARLIREAAFYGVLTPSVQHLDHILQNSACANESAASEALVAAAA